MATVMVHFVLTKKENKTKERMKEEEVEKGNPPYAKFSAVLDYRGPPS